MTPTDSENSGAVKASTLRRDWVLLPAVSILTICALAGSAEILSRWLYPTAQVGFQNCFATNDPTGDAAVKPGSVCWERWSTPMRGAASPPPGCTRCARRQEM